jgi:hypothetical protein
VNWVNISALATGFGTLVLAVATFAAVRSANRAARAAERSLLALLTIDLLYGDYEGGQRMVSRFLLRPGQEDRWLLSVIHHWNVDRPDPR